MVDEQADQSVGRDGADPCVIVGAGPAGLTAAHELQRLGHPAVVLEADHQVGGISRTVEYRNYRFDIGGHRFFTKVRMVQDWWREMLPDDFLVRPRLSRIFYNDRFFDYPLKPLNALRNLGFRESVRVCLSYAWIKLFPYRDEHSFEQWVSNRFGRRLFEIFFKTYTEKVWGMRCSEISADWAAQRIKNLDLVTVVKAAFLGNRGSDGQVTSTLIEEFHYPRLGPGMMWEQVANVLAEGGCPVAFGHRVVRVRHADGRVRSVTVETAGGATEIAGSSFISTMAIRDLFEALDPPPPEPVLQAARDLRYRDFLTVGLILDCPEPFPDNWIYIHSEEVRVGRIQNYKAWSPDMVPDSGRSCVGLEYFVQENDDLWRMADADLVALGTAECAALGLIEAGDVVDGVVIRMPKAYPVYDRDHQERMTVIREYVAGLRNLQLAGRNGQHRYNNQDHSMVTAIYAARNIDGADYDVWNVNVEQSYLEDDAEEGAGSHADTGGTADRLVPRRLEENRAARVLRKAFARYDPVALGIALAVPAALGLFFATAVLLLKGGDSVGANLALLSYYIIGYRVSWGGAVVGMVEAGLLAFGFGWLMASLINAVVGWQERALRKRLELYLIFENVDKNVSDVGR